ncbi:hypothetical protein NE237_015396 [Protea cynaroides]|uniref:Beta-amylase n=1 Tax=Protea cynaroides TaxID=273540 RepID=A0A9Q0QQW3_9MAGN|nr:hypothetical protein NE237_015396 [Protea cynaroides]
MYHKDLETDSARIVGFEVTPSRDNFEHLVGNTMLEIQVGMGPCRELRYPSYPELNGTRKFPGIGAFQCFDKYMVSSLRAVAEAAGKPEWSGGSTHAGHYNMIESHERELSGTHACEPNNNLQNLFPGPIIC